MRASAMFHVYTISLKNPTVALMSLLHNFNILMKALAMFIIHISKISRKFTEMALEEINLYAHVAA